MWGLEPLSDFIFLLQNYFFFILKYESLVPKNQSDF